MRNEQWAMQQNLKLFWTKTKLGGEHLSLSNKSEMWPWRIRSPSNAKQFTPFDLKPFKPTFKKLPRTKFHWHCTQEFKLDFVWRIFPRPSTMDAKLQAKSTYISNPPKRRFTTKHFHHLLFWSWLWVHFRNGTSELHWLMFFQAYHETISHIKP